MTTPPEEETITFAVKDEDGQPLIEFDATSKTAAVIVFLLNRAAKAQREKLASWMIGHGFDPGKGDTLEDLLSELSRQIKDL